MSKGNVEGFLKALFHREAGGNTKIINYAGYIGKYQFGESALIDLGYYTADGTKANDWDGNWIGKHGITSRSAFLDSETAQDVAAREWVALLCKRMKKMKLDAFIGKTMKDIAITESGIIAGAHLKGFGNDSHPGVARFLRSNGVTDPEDGLGTKVSHYVGLFAGYDLGCCNKLSIVFAEKKTGASIPGLRVQVKKNGKPHTTATTDEHGYLPALHGFSAGDQYEILVAKLTGGFKSLKTGIMKDVDATLAFLSPKAKTTTTTQPHKGQPIPRKPATPSVAHPRKPLPKPAVVTAPVPRPAPEAPLAPKAPSVDVDSAPLSPVVEVRAPAAEEQPASIVPLEPDELDRDSAVWDHLEALAPIEIDHPVVGNTSTAAPSPVQATANTVADETTVTASPAPISTATVPAAAAAIIPASPATPAPMPVVKAEKTRSASGHPKVVAKTTVAPKVSANKMPMQRTISGLLFPLDARPKQSYKDGARFFGAGRSGGRKHGGIDLYAPVGTPVRAMAIGKVIQVYPFYLGTWVVEVDHGTFIARYGEVSAKNIKVKKNDPVKRGDQLGVVGQLQGLSFSMLHLEMYATNESPLTNGLTQRQVRPFQRRKDLINPTDSIDLATLE